MSEAEGEGGEEGLGRERGELLRSLRGLIVGGALIGTIFGGLGYLVLPSTGRRAAVGVAMLVLLSLIVLVTFLRQPRRVAICERGLLMVPFLGGPRSLRWAQIADASLRRAPLGRQPLIVRLRLKEGAPLSFSEAEYHGIDALIARLEEALGERFADETLPS